LQGRASPTRGRSDTRKTQPNGLFFFLAMHHAMQWALVVPMTLYYSEVSGYHELIFVLVGAAGFAGGAAAYSNNLDVSKCSDLRQMVVMNVYSWPTCLPMLQRYPARSMIRVGGQLAWACGLVGCHRLAFFPTRRIGPFAASATSFLVWVPALTSFGDVNTRGILPHNWQCQGRSGGAHRTSNIRAIFWRPCRTQPLTYSF